MSVIADLIRAGVDPDLVRRVKSELTMRDRRQAVRERQAACRERKEARLAAKQAAKSEK